MTFRKLRMMFLRMSGIILVFLAVFVRPAWPAESEIGYYVELAGYFCLLGGLSIRIWSILYIGGQKSKILTNQGPYSLCRHPLYVGSFFVAIGAGLCFENIPMLIAILVLIVPVHIIVARMEERHLMELFPMEYPEYKKLVPRFIPNFKNYRSSETVEVPVRMIRRVLLDTAGILMLPEIEDLLEILHSHGIIPILWYFPHR